MSFDGYDRNGNFSYEERGMTDQLCPRPAYREAVERLGAAGCLTVTVLGTFCLIVAITLGGWYVAGRAVGAGVRDAQRPSSTD